MKTRYAHINPVRLNSGLGQFVLEVLQIWNSDNGWLLAALICPLSSVSDPFFLSGSDFFSEYGSAKNPDPIRKNPDL